MNSQYHAAQYNLSNFGDVNYPHDDDHFNYPRSDSNMQGPLSETTPKHELSHANLRSDRPRKLGRPVTAN